MSERERGEGNSPAGNEEDLRDKVAGWFRAGLRAPEIERRLRESGVSPEKAAGIVDAALAKHMAVAGAAQRRKDRVALLCGTGLCAAGVLLLVVGLLQVDRFGIGPLAGGLAGVVGGSSLIIRTLF
jgi:hypothetical protein